MKKSFNIERSTRDEAAIDKVIGGAIERERKAAFARGDEGPFGKKMFGPKSASLLPLVEKQIESIEAQLAGKREGYIPEMPKFDKKPPKDFK